MKDREARDISAIYVQDDNLRYLSKEDAQMLIRITGKLCAIMDANLSSKLAEIAGYTENKWEPESHTG